MRFSVNAGLTEVDLALVVAVCRDIRDEVDLANWPSTRRKLRGKTRLSPADSGVPNEIRLQLASA